MTDDLTNPDVLAALEIAEVGWNSIEGHWFQLGVSGDGKRVVVNDVSGHFWSEATPADLDHALKEWLEWLDKRTPHTVLLTLFDGEARCTLDDAAGQFVDEAAESPLLAVAAAVVKLGKPEETDDERV